MGGGKRPEILKVAGWDVIEEQDGRYGVWDNDSRREGPFDTQAEAVAAAQASPRR